MSRLDILGTELESLRAEKLTAVGARLRTINRRIDILINVLIRKKNYPDTNSEGSAGNSMTVFHDDSLGESNFMVMCGNSNWRIICDDQNLLIQSFLDSDAVWQTVQALQKPL